MLNRDEVIHFYTNLKAKSSTIQDTNKKTKFVMSELGKYSLSEWCEIGHILRSANLI